VTIRKGQPWGEDGPLADDGVVVRSDAEAAATVAATRAAGRPAPMLGLLGGDLYRTLGGRSDAARLRSADARRYPIDLGIAVVDGVEHCFVAHVIAHRRGWRGRAIAAMNAQWLGTWDLGPKSHPNDGLLDVSDGRMGLADRLAARRRLPTGTHLPHPTISVRRTASIELELETPTPVFVDGVALGPARHLVLHLEPDALTVVV
jgi:hypothetical protein